MSSVSVSRSVVILLSNGKKVHAYTISFSLKGMGILTHVPGEVGTILKFVFELPIANEIYKVKVNGKITHSYLRADKYQSGIEFQNVTEELSQIFSRFVKEIHDKRVR